MKILHVIPSISRKSGGPAVSVLNNARLLCDEHEIEICATTEDLTDSEKFELESISEFKVRLFDFKNSHSTKYSAPLVRYVGSQLNKVHVIHIHAGFSVLSELTALMCIFSKQHFVYRPLGTLSPFSLKSGNRLFKKMLLPLERLILRQASSVQATSPQEKEDILRIQKPDFLQIVPPISIDDSKEKLTPTKKGKTLKLGFLSRIHPKKNIEFLFQLLSNPNLGDVELYIGGEGDKEYVDELLNTVSNFDISDNVHYLGFVDDSKKEAFFAKIDWFVLPSFHENFGISVVEALSYSVPCLTSNHVDSAQYFSNDLNDLSAPVLVQPLDKNIWENTLEKIKLESDEIYAERSHKAFEEVIQQFGNQSVKQKLEKLYDFGNQAQ